MDPAPQPLSYAAPANPSSKRFVGIYVWSVLLFFGGALELLDALITAGDFGTAYEQPTDRPLVWCQVVGAAIVLLAALALILRKKLSWSVVLILLFVSAVMQILPIRATRAALAEAIHRGGDTGSLTALGRQLSLLLGYGLIGLCLVTAGYLCLQSVRQSFNARG